MQEKLIEYLKKKENPYQIKVGNMVVNIEYSKNALLNDNFDMELLRTNGTVYFIKNLMNVY